MTVMEAITLSNVHHDITRMANELAKETVKSSRKKSYVSHVKEQKKVVDELKKGFHQSFEQYYERMKHGIKLLVAQGLFRGVDVEKLIASLANLRERKAGGESNQDAFGVSDDDMISFYECGSGFFEKNEFESAADIFLVLTFFNALISSFWASLGMAEEMKQDFNAAALAFLMASEVQEEELTWVLKSAECCIKAGKIEQAKRLLDILIDEAARDTKHAELLQKAKIMRNSNL